MRANGQVERFQTIRHNVSSAKENLDTTDFKVIVDKKDVLREALSITDIVQSNRVPVLRHLDNAKLMFASSSLLDTASFSVSGEDSLRNIIKSGGSADIGHRSTTKKIGPASAMTQKKGSEEDNKLALALQYMNNSKEILDSSRLLFEAALLFDGLQSYQRAVTCYIKSTKRVDPSVIVDTYDLPSDAVYQRKVARMSKFRLTTFLENRNNLRSQLILNESNRQRLRARASYCQLARIHLLTHLYDLQLTQKYITESFTCCAGDEEHTELLVYYHDLIKTFAAEEKQEMSMNKQLIRGVAGPIAESHINILHDLEMLDDTNIDILQWLAFRYAEKCDFEASKSYFKRIRDLTEPEMDMQETLLLWRPKAVGGNALVRRGKPTSSISMSHYNSGGGGEGDGGGGGGEASQQALPEESAEMQHIKDGIRANISKSTVGGYTSLDPPDHSRMQPSGSNNNSNRGSFVGASDISSGGERRDLAWFGGKHEQSHTVLYSVPKQGWNTVNL